MHVFIQACILGLLTGGVYALMASGLALGFGVMRVINVAQGALIILGAYLSYTLYSSLGIDPFIGLLVLTPAMFVLGVVLQIVFLTERTEEDDLQHDTEHEHRRREHEQADERINPETAVERVAQVSAEDDQRPLRDVDHPHDSEAQSEPARHQGCLLYTSDAAD